MTSVRRVDSFSQGLNSLASSLHSNKRSLSPVYLNPYQQVQMASNGLMRKVVAALPTAATTSWGKPSLESGDEKTVTAILQAMQSIPVHTESETLRGGVRTAIKEAGIMGMLCGNGAILPEIDDGRPSHEPLDPKKIKSIKALYVVDRWSISPIREVFGAPSRYQISASNQISGVYHASRVYIVPGFRRTALEKKYGLGIASWGDYSVIELVAEAFSDYLAAVKDAGRMLKNFDLMIHQVRKLGELSALASKGNIEAQCQLDGIRRKSEVAASLRDQANEVLADLENEQYTPWPTNSGGYRDLADFMRDWFTANSPIPWAIISGEFPGGGGLQSGGKTKEERELANDTTRAYQSDLQQLLITDANEAEGFQDYLPPGLINLACLAKNGPTKGKIPEGLNWKWNPLYPETPAERMEADTAWGNIALSFSQFDSGIGPAIMQSRFATPDSPLTLPPEMVKRLEEAAIAPPAPPEELPPEEVPSEELPPEELSPEELPPEELPPEELVQDAMNPVEAIALNCSKALEFVQSMRGSHRDFSRPAIAVARKLSQQQRITSTEREAIAQWQQQRGHYRRSQPGTLEHAAWLLRGGDEMRRLNRDL